MSEDPGPSAAQEVKPKITIDATPEKGHEEASREASLESLKDMQEKAGQISESEMEEENLVKEFFNSLLTILRPFSKTLEISVSALPENYKNKVNQAHLYLTGQLILVCKGGEVEILNLAEKRNREFLVEITGEIMTKLKSIVDSYKSKVEKRVQFLMLVTQELQKVAKVFSEI